MRFNVMKVLLVSGCEKWRFRRRKNSADLRPVMRELEGWYSVCNRPSAIAGVSNHSKLEADGDVNGVALERVLGVELVIPLDQNRERLGRIGAGGEGRDRPHAIDA